MLEAPEWRFKQNSQNINDFSLIKSVTYKHEF
nr:MAG TPA: cell division cylcle protein 27 [Caudoviricetes sp.]